MTRHDSSSREEMITDPSMKWSARPTLGSDDAERLLSDIRVLMSELHLSSGYPIDLNSDLQRELGLDSLAVVELLDRLEDTFAIRLPEAVLATARTPRDVLSAIAVERTKIGAPSIVTPMTGVSHGTDEPWPEHARTVNEALLWHVERHPGLVAVRSLGEEQVDISYGMLHGEASLVGTALRKKGLGRGERVAIMLPTGGVYFSVFLGVLLAGCVPVPLYPPMRRDAIEEHLRRQAGLLASAGAAVLVTVPEALLVGRLLRALAPSLQGVTTPRLLAQHGQPLEPLPAPTPEDLALIQYTSGSTGDPKGVMLSHAQLLANITAMGSAAKVSSADVFVSWLPLYHDMGLIGAFLAPLCFGFPLAVLSPLRFLAHPVTWLEAISTQRGTISAAPNFAYEACVRRIRDADIAHLDLSSWRIAFNGSEAVSPRGMEHFVERFRPAGFSASAMCPAYGLAEVGVGVAFSPIGRGPRIDHIDAATLRRTGRAIPVVSDSHDIRDVVSVGLPLPNYEVAIEGAEGERQTERHEGRVLVRGPSATRGYFSNPEATDALWHAGWLDTGDLGYLADGELYLTGRAKDIVIRAGRNVHPEELEQVLGELDGTERGGVAVFPSVDPRFETERLVAAVETGMSKTDELETLRAAIVEETVKLLGAPPDEVVLVPAGSLLRTASGKLRRVATREAFERGVLGRAGLPFSVQLLRLTRSAVGSRVSRLPEVLVRYGFGVCALALAMVLAATTALIVAFPIAPERRWRVVRYAGDRLRRRLHVRLTLEGVPPAVGKPCIMVANHDSFVDGLVLILALSDPVVFVASTDLQRTPFVGTFLGRLGCVFVERGRADRSAVTLDELATVVRSGRRLVIFPEGSLARSPGVRPFHLGAFVLAAQTGCPIVPVGISGTRHVLQAGTFMAQRGDVAVRFGDPVAPSASNFAAEIAIRDIARTAVVSLAAETLA